MDSTLVDPDRAQDPHCFVTHSACLMRAGSADQQEVTATGCLEDQGV